MTEAYALQLKELVSKAAQADCEHKVFGAKSHEYCLNPVASPEEVRRFEREYHLTLPEEYVFFLTKVGNGGAGPYYGLYSLRGLRAYNNAQQNDNPVFIDKHMTLETYNQKVSGLWEDKYDCSDDNDLWDQVELEIMSGVLVIGTQGCTYDHLLMCRGSETGKVVYDNNDWFLDAPPFLTGMTFLDWYEQYFEEIIAGHNVEEYGYQRLGTEEELCKAYGNAADLKTKAAILSSFWRFETISEQTKTLLMNVREKKLDTTRLRLLFKKDLPKGLEVFESLLAGKNADAAVLCAREMPASCKNRFYESMLKLLYGENTVDIEKLLFFMNDCTCKKAADFIAFATDGQKKEDLRKTAVYVMGHCDDVLDYTEQFILWMKGDSYNLAHTALQAMLHTNAASDELIRAYQWMWDKYKNDNTMRANLQRAPIKLDTI